jgi:rubredoxin
MVTTTRRDDMTWYECEVCGLLFDAREDAEQHEANCDAEEPSYIQ